MPGRGESGWHGAFEYYPAAGALRLHFHYTGLEPLRWCEMHPTFHPHILIGCDYRFRFIRMTFVRSWRYLYSSGRYLNAADHLRTSPHVRSVALGLQDRDLAEREWVFVAARVLAPIPDASDDESDGTVDPNEGPAPPSSGAASDSGVWL